MFTSTLLLQLALMALTILVYLIARHLFLRYKHPLLHPVFVSAGVIIIILHFLHLTFADYTPAKNWLTGPLGPATVALAIPVYKQRARLHKLLLPLLSGVTVGSMCTIAIVITLAILGTLSLPVVNALAVKSVTTAIAVELAKLHGADPSLTAVFTVVTCMLGGMFGPFVLNRLRITDACARGIALGTISAAIGTAAALAEGETAGALASLAMIAAAIVTSLLAPWYIPFLLHLLGH
jgi:putative effector of murein hydrolase